MGDHHGRTSEPEARLRTLATTFRAQPRRCWVIDGMFRRDPRENLILWSWTHHQECADRYAAASGHEDNAHLNFVRLTSDAEIDNFVTTACRQVAR